MINLGDGYHMVHEAVYLSQVYTKKKSFRSGRPL